MSLTYPIKLTPDDNGTFLVTCPALPEVTTFGEDEADAVLRAQGARKRLRRVSPIAVTSLCRPDEVSRESPCPLRSPSR